MKQDWSRFFLIIMFVVIILIVIVMSFFYQPLALKIGFLFGLIGLILGVIAFIVGLIAGIITIWDKCKEKDGSSKIFSYLSNMKENILSKLHCPRKQIRVFVNAAHEDMKSAQKIMKVLRKNQICVLPPLDDKSGYGQESLNKKLVKSQGVIVVYDRNPDFKWVKGQLIHCQRIRAKGVALKVALVYTVEKKPLKEIELLSNQLVKCSIEEDKSSIEKKGCLQSFIEELKNQKSSN